MDPVHGPIRSRFRGLSWDKKHQGWRVRIYYAGKQRHVGRFEDEMAASKAYDKAAVFLYGPSAVTNHGLASCYSDPTEVSAFILLAKEQAGQEQQGRSQQRHCEPFKAQLAADSSPLAVPLLQQHNAPTIQQQQQAYPYQQQLPLGAMETLAAWQQLQQQQLAAGLNMQQCGLHQLQQLQGSAGLQHTLSPASGQFVVLHSPVAMDTASAVSGMVTASIASGSTISSSIASGSTISNSIASGSTISNSVASGSTISNSIASGSTISSSIASGSTISNSSSSGSFMLHAGKHLMLPVDSGATAGFNAGGVTSHMMQQQQLVLQQQQHQHQLAASASFEQQQQQHQQQMLFFNSSQPLQLSVHPHLTTIAGHMSAAAAAAPNPMQRQLLQQQLQDMAMSQPMSFTAGSVAECSSNLPMLAVGQQQPAAGLASALSLGLVLGTDTDSGAACPMFVENMLQGYASAAAATAAGSVQTVSPLAQMSGLLSKASGSSCCAFVEGSSSSWSSWSPMVATPHLPMEAAVGAAGAAALAANGVQCSWGVMAPTGTSCHVAGSPTYSCSSSSSSSSCSSKSHDNRDRAVY